MSKLKPAVVFDLDDTLFETPDINWGAPGKGWEEALQNAKPIPESVFLYNAIDFMVNDPPEWADIDPKWPREIFFCTARPEFYREETIYSLMELTQDSGSSISKRLIMRPHNNDSDLSHVDINTSFEAKKHAYEQVEKKGFKPVLVFDNSEESVIAYIQKGVNVVHKTIATKKDKSFAL